MKQRRDYNAIEAELLAFEIPTRAAGMERLVDLLWRRLESRGLSWIGFYLFDPDRPAELTLGSRRDKPACSPISLQGACGRTFLTRRTLIVADVARLGANYIACDPRDRSELVVPMLEADGRCWGVLDADSHDLESFSLDDAERIHRLCHLAGLTTLTPPAIEHA